MRSRGLVAFGLSEKIELAKSGLVGLEKMRLSDVVQSSEVEKADLYLQFCKQRIVAVEWRGGFSSGQMVEPVS